MLFWFNITLQTLWPYPLKKCCVWNTEILYSGQQRSSNPVILSSALNISHVQPNHSSVYRPFSLSNRHFDTILRNQSTQLSSKFIILSFSVTFWIRVVKQLLVSRVVSKSAVERGARMDKTRVYFFFFLGGGGVCFSFLFPFKRFPFAVYLFLVLKQILTNPL